MICLVRLRGILIPWAHFCGLQKLSDWSWFIFHFSSLSISFSFYLHMCMCVCLYYFHYSLGSFWAICCCAHMRAHTHTHTHTRTDSEKLWMFGPYKCVIVQYTWTGCETWCNMVHRCTCVSACETAAPYKATERYQPLIHWVEIMQKRGSERERDFLTDGLSVHRNRLNGLHCHRP